jgi:LacI family transcriptional regulator
VVLCSPRLLDDELRASLAYFPASVLVNRALDSDSTSVLRTNDDHGSRAAVEHLLQRGHRAIGMLAGPERSFSGRVRAQGYLGAMDDAGVRRDPDWIQHGLPMVEASQQTAVDLLTRHPELTALFCFNDLVAVGAMKACAELGRVVGEDFAIIGYDDIPLASLVTPALTTVHVPRYELGYQAGKMLLAQISGEYVKRDAWLTVELVVRASAP